MVAVFTTRARACVQPHSYARCFTWAEMSWSGCGVCDRVVGVVLRVAGRGGEVCVDGEFRMCVAELAPNLRIAGWSGQRVWSCAEVEMNATEVGEVKVRFCLLYFIMGMFIYCRAL